MPMYAPPFDEWQDAFVGEIRGQEDGPVITPARRRLNTPVRAQNFPMYNYDFYKDPMNHLGDGLKKLWDLNDLIADTKKLADHEATLGAKRERLLKFTKSQLPKKFSAIKQRLRDLRDLHKSLFYGIGPKRVESGWWTMLRGLLNLCFVVGGRMPADENWVLKCQRKSTRVEMVLHLTDLSAELACLSHSMRDVLDSHTVFRTQYYCTQIIRCRNTWEELNKENILTSWF